MPDNRDRQSVLAVIPARGGSKRIPRKNIRLFLGVPMLTRTISMIKATNLFDHIVVSTDDDEIAEVALSAGAQVPFRRPPDLSNDIAGTLPVVIHAIREMQARGALLREVCCVYPAAVLSRPSDVRNSHALLASADVDYVFTATSFPFPIQRALRKTTNGFCEMYWPQHRETRSQDLEPAFHDAGQFYFGKLNSWLESRPIFGSRSKMLELPRYRVQDIDTPEDWVRAEMIYRLLEQHDSGE
jgi:pseudaminic acid cytidylyltransferase